MARPLRIELAGGLYHVTSRGDRREDIYADDTDREIWLEVFGQVCHRYNWVCHSWCQMDNHFHLLVETAENNLSAGMRQLNGVYTQRINRRHARVGHVFQGRFKAILVERDGYLLELARYVVLNPVRAGMVADADDWKWSAYRAMASQEAAPAWLQTDWVLSQFGATRQEAIARYIEFVRAGNEPPGIWSKLRGQVFLGSDEFIQKALVDSGAELAIEVPRAQRRAFAKPLEEYAASYPDRRMAMAAAYASGKYTMQEVANHFGVHYATVSRTVVCQQENMQDYKT